MVVGVQNRTNLVIYAQNYLLGLLFECMFSIFEK